jgi:hypothetical protein
LGALPLRKKPSSGRNTSARDLRLAEKPIAKLELAKNEQPTPFDR